MTLISGKGENICKNNVQVYSVPTFEGQSRFERMRKVVNAVFEKAIEVDADIYHVHDPELLRIVLKLSKIKSNGAMQLSLVQV